MFLQISQNSQENNLFQSLFFNNCRPQTCNIIKKEILAQVFFCELCEIYKKTFFTDYLQWLLLIVPNWFMKINPLLAACYRLFQMHLQVNWSKFTLDSGKDSSEIQLLRKYISFSELFRKFGKLSRKQSWWSSLLIM